MSSAADVIGRFGGQSALARSLGLHQSTVQHWAKTGQIPAWRHDQVLRAARQLGVTLAADDLGGPGRAEASASGTALRFSRAAGASPLPHGRADVLPRIEDEIGTLREEVGHLRQAVMELAEELRELRRALTSVDGERRSRKGKA